MTREREAWRTDLKIKHVMMKQGWTERRKRLFIDMHLIIFYEHTFQFTCLAK